MFERFVLEIYNLWLIFIVVVKKNNHGFRSPVISERTSTRTDYSCDVRIFSQAFNPWTDDGKYLSAPTWKCIHVVKFLNIYSQDWKK